MIKDPVEINPTSESYNELQLAFDHLNLNLFNAELPKCLITYQRIKNSYGYHSGNRWTNKEGFRSDEIAMNPTYFATRTIKETLGTLGHEMVHLWQEHFGKPGRGRYHNKEWAEKMKSIGLHPENIENPKRETGDRVHHYIVENGLFEKIVEDYVKSGFTISWLDRMIEESPEYQNNSEFENEEIANNKEIVKSKKENDNIHGITKKSGGQRVRYDCPNKHYSVWGKKEIDPKCGKCDEYMIVYDKSFIDETQNE